MKNTIYFNMLTSKGVHTIAEFKASDFKLLSKQNRLLYNDCFTTYVHAMWDIYRNNGFRVYRSQRCAESWKVRG